MKKMIFTLLASLGIVLGFAACGSGGGGGSSTVTTAGTCSAGYVYTATYGCLPQSTCPAGYGMYNNTCVVGTTSTGTCSAGYVYSAQYGCLPQSSCSAGYAMYNNQCIYVGTSSTNMCPAGFVLTNNTCMIAGTTTGSSLCQGACAVGQIQTAYGCLPQNSCATCYGYFNHYCVGGPYTGGSWYFTPY
jgi:hypothetical protein